MLGSRPRGNVSYRRHVRSWLVAVLLVASPTLLAQVSVHPETGQVDVGRALRILADPDSTLDFDTVRRLDADTAFRDNPTNIFNAGLDPRPYWLRLALVDAGPNSGDQPRQWLLEVTYPALDHLDVWVPDGNGGYRHMRSGDQQPIAERLLRLRNFVFPLKLSPAQPEVVYLRVQTRGSLQVPVRLWTPEAYTEHVTTEHYLFGVFYGIMLVMLLYNAFIYASVRDDSYLLYIAFIGSATVLQLSQNGFGTLFIWGNHPAFTNQVAPLAVAMASGFAPLFAARFLELRRTDPWFNVIALLTGIVALGQAPLAFLLPTEEALTIATSTAAASATVCFVVGVRGYRRKTRAARFYLLAWVAMLGGVLLKVLETFGVMPTSFVTTYAFQIGSALEVVLLALALADRINLERHAKLQAQSDALAAREASVRNLQQYRTVVENMQEGVFQMSADGSFTNANLALARILGYDSIGALMAQPLDLRGNAVVDQSDRHELQRLILSNDRVSAFELRIRRHDGSTFWAAISAQIVRDAQGNVVQMEGVLTDISTRRAAERLARERASAEAETRAKSAFLARMSHELRTPLNAVVGFAELAVQNTEPERLPDYLRNIQAASHSLLAVINDVLDISKIEAGKLALACRDFDLRPRLDHLRTLFAQQAADKGVTLSITVDPDVPTRLHGDDLRLQQVLINLLGNAVKFCDQGDVALRVTRADPASPGVLRFAVSDTGIGIDPAAVTRLFEPFSQVGDPADRRYGGTGLGLAICKQLVGLMDGQITVDSTPQKGSTFTVTLPFAAAQQHADDDQPRQYLTGHLQHDLSGRRVLLAEDNALNRDLVREVLRSTGLEQIGRAHV